MYILAPSFFSSAGQDFYVLFDKTTHKALKFAATEHGLTWAMSQDGKLLYYKNGKIKITPNYVYIVPREGTELIKSDNVYVQKFNYSETPNIEFLV